ncbi:MAG: TetR family transcriptional regulator [Spirochaetes bacterium]|jgi:AcrR family transcriptional regulator|nr:TetR family transcriptional regulator [Spirochaetota bacterium]
MAKELPERTPRTRLTREERKAQTRARLIESAQELFARHGYEGTSIDQVATDAGYTRGAFYANFANKEALMQELISRGFEGDLRGIVSMGTAAQAKRSIDEIAGLYAQLARSFYEEPSNTLWMLEFQLAAVRHPELRGAYTEQFSRLRAAVRDIILQIFDDRKPSRKKDAARFADVFIAVLSGVSLIKILDPEEIDESIFADTFRALVEGMDKR